MSYKMLSVSKSKGYQKLERRKDKHLKRRNWNQKGGHVAPIIIPSTPGGILAKMMREVADAEATPGLHFKVVEKGGKRLESLLSRPNPTASDHCVMSRRNVWAVIRMKELEIVRSLMLCISMIARMMIATVCILEKHQETLLVDH